MLKKLRKWISSHRGLAIGSLCGYCALLTAFVLLQSLSFGDLYTTETPERQALDSGWSLYAGDKLLERYIVLPYSPEDDSMREFTLQATLPDPGFGVGMLVTHTYQTLLTASVDGQVVFKTPYRPNWMNKTPGSDRAVIPLPQDFAGKTITLRYTRVVPTDPTGATEVLLVNPLVRSSLLLGYNDVFFFTLVAVVLLGCILLIAAGVVDRQRICSRPLFYLSLFATITPVWLLCNSKLALFFTGNLILVHNLEYICFFLFTLPIWAILRTNWNHCPRTTCLGIGLLVGFYTLAITLKVTGIADFQALNTLYHLLMLVISALFIWVGIRGLQSLDPSLRVFFTGFLLLIATGMADLVRFYLFPETYTAFLVWGMAAMALCLTASYLMSARSRIRESAEDSLYKTLAYTDKLTGLHNRLTFEEDVAALSADTGRYRTIVFINTDVNAFKAVNDSYGHIMGDRVLQVIAGVLGDTFDGICKCYRMGGDEFCLIGVNQDPCQLEMLMGRVNGELDHAIVKFPISLAFGVAEYNHFLHHDLMAVFKAADDRMYEHKRASKRRRQAELLPI